MRQDPTVPSTHHDDTSSLQADALASPDPSPASLVLSDADGYFDMHTEGTHSPTSLRSAGVSSIEMMSAPATTMAALTALQYLPMPVLVLDAAKNVVLANEAMGRLLGIDPSELENDDGAVATVTDILWGQHMAHLGIEILAHGSPVLVSWDVCLLSL